MFSILSRKYQQTKPIQPLHHSVVHGQSLECGGSADAFIAANTSETFTLELTDNLKTLVISTCHALTDFDTTLTLLDDADSIVAFDDNGCAETDIGQSLITATDVPFGSYSVLLQAAQDDIEGVYNLTVLCEVATTTTTTTAEPSAEPTVEPTGAPTIAPTMGMLTI